ncbi:hypothetical protein HYALB_00005390 [Hymenoscyphus albidus]|uniref:RAD50-interacting protein 1 n=1 Tax=Hymenoscyphus albidus TaxID=595503 RepID=A0A9N9LJD4_9HELO|nr:hypothetical protein HYALB_00005390 [Hymenoscyphus albidus]
MATLGGATPIRVSSPYRGPVAVLVDPEDDVPNVEMSVRLDDYLNDKIQTRADFASLPELLVKVEQQTKHLQEQLQDARSKLDASKQASADYTSKMLEQTKQFKIQQKSVQKRLKIVTNSDSPEEATKFLKGPMERLRRVELAAAYVQLLKDVDDLINDARSHLPAEPKEALKSYVQLKELSISLIQLQEEAEGAAVHLVGYVQKAVEGLWAEMQKIMTDEFEAILKKAEWPGIQRAPTREWSDCFEKLLDLQAPEILTAREPLILLPMSVLAKNFRLQFKYHFFSDKPTNATHRLGEFFFEWFIGTIAKWQDYLRETLSPILAAHFRGSILAGNSLYVDPVAAFITALLPVMKEKIDLLLTDIINDPQLLSRFIPQLMKFDEALRTRFNYDAGNPELGWKGLTWDVLSQWFNPWLSAEKEFALARYREIIRSPDNGQIDFDSSSPGKTKHTHGSTKVMDLLQTVTYQYQPLRRFSHKVKFLIDIQAEILDQYYGLLNDSLEAYMSATTTVGRTLHGISREEQAKLEGVGGLEILCKVYGSADYVTAMLKEWSNDEFFVDLWDQLQNRAKVTEVDANLVGEMTYGEVKDCTSNAVGSEEEGSVFDVTINNFERLQKKSESLLIEAVKYSFQTSFRQYFSKPQWTTVGADSAPTPSVLAITPELDQPLRVLKENMTFLYKTLSYPPFRRIWRSSFDYLQDLLFQEVLVKQDFSSLGSARFVQDILAIQSVVQSCIDSTSRSASVLGMEKLKEGAALLSLPVEAHEEQVSLKDAYQEIFSDAKGAERMLKKLGLERLSNFEARRILQHRVEASL